MDDFQELSWAWFAGWVRLRRLSAMCGFGGFFFESVWGASFLDFGWILGGFWEAKMVPKSIFGRFFGKLFFERDFPSIFRRFREAPNPENMHGA